MSMQLMVDALNAKVGNPGRKLVLIKLADNANDKGECWPSYQHVADQCEMGRSTVKAHIKALAEAGFIRIEARNDGKSSNRYVLTIERGNVGDTRSKSDPVKNKPGQKNTTTRSESDPLTRSESDPRTSHSFEPVIEPDDACGVDAPAPACAPAAPVEYETEPERVDTGADDQPEPEYLSNLFNVDQQPLIDLGDRRKFAMHWQWEPGPNFGAECRLAGVQLDRIQPEQAEMILGEFRSYWVAQETPHTQAQWEHKLRRRLQQTTCTGHAHAAGAGSAKQQARRAVTAAAMDIHNTDW